MKAKLINIDLMVRIICPDNATDEDCYELGLDKALKLVYEDGRSWLGEGMSDLRDDTECPYDPKNDESGEIIGYQIESVDGRHIQPDAFWSFEVFRSQEQARKWMIEEAIINPKNKWQIVPIFDDEIEEPTYIDEEIMD